MPMKKMTVMVMVKVERMGSSHQMLPHVLNNRSGI